jgi:general secretion pathway protein D
MTPRLVRLVFTASLLAALPTAQAQPPLPVPAPAAPAPAVRPEDEPVSVKLPNGDLDSIISLLEQYTGKIALRPATLPTATYNLDIPRKIPKSEAIVYIQTVLAMNRIGISPLGPNAFKVVDLTMTKAEAPEMISGSAFDQPASGKIATKVFQLDFLRVAELQGMVQTMLNPNVQGFIALQNANAAIITDSVSNLQRVELLLRDLDRPSGGMKPKFYALKSAKASDLVGKLRSILAGPLQLQLGQATTYSADDRTNQIIVITDPRQHAFFDELIEKLDGKSDPNTRNEVIYLKHAEATKVSTLLTQLVTGQTAASQRTNGQSVRPGQTGPAVVTPAPGQPTAPVMAGAATPSVDSLLGSGSNEFSGLVTIIPDERSNAVIVSGTVDDIRLLTTLIDKLDTILAQVRLEVVIAEVTLDDASSTGISALGLKIDGDKLIGFSGSIAGATASAGTVTRPTATNSVSGPWDLAGELAISSTPRKNNTNILSSPSITTTHNREAIFFFGETRPVISGTTATPTSGGTASGFSTQSNITPQEIGTKITVKPLIGTDGTVQLDIKQDISDVTGTVQIDNNTQYIIGKRQTTSYITARSGQIYVLAGYQKDKDSRNTTRLGPIPIIGDLLGSRTRSNNRVELVIFLRPYVLTNSAADTAEAMKRVQTLDQKEIIKQRLDPAYVPPKPSLIDKVLK